MNSNFQKNQSKLIGDLNLAHPVQLNAEAMTLMNFRLKNSQSASENSLTSFLNSKTKETGKAAYIFTGASNRYDLLVTDKLALNGNTLDKWTLNQELGSNIDTDRLMRSTIATGLTNKEDLAISVMQGKAEPVQADYVELVSIAPSQVEAEDYVTFYDTSSGNQGRAYRQDDVDIQTTKDINGGYNVGWIRTGEWLEYSVEAPEAESYLIGLRVAASGTEQKALHVNGQTVEFSATGGWQNWKTVNAQPLKLAEGVNTIRLEALTSGFNLNYLTLTPVQTNQNLSEVTVPQASPQLGTNLRGINFWSSQLPFLDSFKSSRPWKVNKNWQGLPLALDEHGWVKRLPTTPEGKTVSVETIFHREIGNYYGGKYVVLYDGEGTLQYGLDAKKDATASRPGRDVINVTPSDRGIFLTLDATDPSGTGDYLRNIRVVPLEAETLPERFTPEFLDKVEDFAAFRFMDWMETNNSHQKDWSARPTLDTATWTKVGAPVEVMVELANQTDSDPWFTMPHQATDDYVTRFAQYVQEHLDSDLKVYVEYSNEVWNKQFQQSQWVAKQGEQTWKNSSASKVTKRTDWYSRRTTEITQIWDEVFGSDKERVIGVMGAQAANPWIGKRALQYAWSSEDLSHSELGIDAIAIAPYFGEYIGHSKHEAQLEQWTKEPDGGLGKLFDEITQGGVLQDGPTGGALQQSSDWIKKHVQLAEQESLELLAYEGGQHLVGKQGVENNQTITDLFIQANRDPRMGKVYQDYLERWYELGGGLFMNFSDIGPSTRWGSWGALEHVFDESSPKYDALMNFLTPVTDSSLASG